MEATEPRVEAKLATTTADGETLWCSEVYVDGEFLHASEWTRHPARAILAGRDLKASAVSDWAYREARAEVFELFARAS